MQSPSSNLRLRLKHLVVAIVAIVGQLLLGYLLQERPKTHLVGTIFLISGALSGVATLFYVLAFLPRYLAREKKIDASERITIADVIEVKMEDAQLAWPDLDRITSRDWTMFLAQSPFELKTTIMNVLAERPFIQNGKTFLLAYVRCENLNFDKHVKVFEGWILHAPDVREARLTQADWGRSHFWALATSFLAGVLFISLILGKSYRQMTILELLIAIAIPSVIFPLAGFAYRKNFARRRFRRGKKELAAKYLPVYEALVESKSIDFFRIATGPAGLLIAAQPTESAHDHEGIVAVVSPLGDSLENLLGSLSSI